MVSIRKLCKKPYFKCFVTFLGLTVCHFDAKGQTVGSNFGVFTSKSNLELVQSIGQPYSSYYSGKVSKVVLDQGHILPSIYSAESVSKSVLKIQVFPNPASEYVVVSIEGNSKIQQIDLCDVQSKVVLNQNEFPTLGEYKLNLESLSSGVYFMKVIDENGNNSIIKLIKEN